MPNIYRRGNDGGRWPKYDLVINGEVAGRIERTAHDGETRWYCAHGYSFATSRETQAEAEAVLIEHAEEEKRAAADQLRARLADKSHPWGSDQAAPLRYVGQHRTQAPFGGLFWYSGFGTGTYFSTDGRCYPCQTSEGSLLAWREEIEMKIIDCFDGYRPVYLGD